MTIGEVAVTNPATLSLFMVNLTPVLVDELFNGAFRSADDASWPRPHARISP